MAELAVTLFVMLLVFGATQIPALGDAIGRRVRGPGPNRRESPPEERSEPRP
jgi:sec-independent protein translocase protein TatA